MKIIFLLLIFCFHNTNQLICLTNCFNIKIDKFESFDERFDKYLCQKSFRERCYGRIMTYYDEIGEHKYISYTFGSHNHIIEKEIKELSIKNNFELIIYILFIIDSFDTNELVINVYIICKTSDNCALKYVKKFFYLYNKQINPLDQLRSLFYNKTKSSTLSCYNYRKKQSEICSTYEYSTCIISSTDKFLHGCYSGSNTKFEYVFMITPFRKNSIKKIYELIICNKNDCNQEFILKQAEFIVYNYTLGISVLLNSSNKFKLYLIYLLLFKYIFF